MKSYWCGFTSYGDLIRFDKEQLAAGKHKYHINFCTWVKVSKQLL